MSLISIEVQGGSVCVWCGLEVKMGSEHYEIERKGQRLKIHPACWGEMEAEADAD